MRDRTSTTESVEDPAASYIPPPVRAFSVTYVDKEVETFAAHYFDTSTGAIVFIDETYAAGKRSMYYREVVAAGQWRKVTEITVSDPMQQARVN